MSDDIFAKLDGVFAKHDERKEAAAKAEKERKETAEARLAAYEEVRKEIIRPVFEEIGQYIRGKGHSFRIESDADKPSQNSKYRPDPCLKFILIPKGYPSYHSHNNQLPHFEIRGSLISDAVYFAKSTMLGNGGGMSSSDGSAKLSELTPDMIKERLANLISEVFRR